MSNSSNSNSQSTYKIVTYQEFESSFKRTHPKLKYNEARKQFNAACEKLKKDHGCDKIKSHKKRVKHWSSEFHTAAGEQIKQWKLQFEKKKLNQLQNNYINTSRQYRTRSGPRRCEERPGNERSMQILQNMVDEYCLADPRRQSETSICMSSIPQVVAHLKELGITISGSSATRRFEPSFNDFEIIQ